MIQEIHFLALGPVTSEHISLNRAPVRHGLQLFYQSVHQALRIEHACSV